jgi:hypothetical protein
MKQRVDWVRIEAHRTQIYRSKWGCAERYSEKTMVEEVKRRRMEGIEEFSSEIKARANVLDW